MKAHTAALVAMVAPLYGCDLGVLDNYDEPTSTLTGMVAHEGTPIGLRSNGVQLELWQPGYELNEKIPIHVGQDGSFSAVLFDGTYKINLLPGNGPWLDTRDTVEFELNGHAEVTVPVVPFYTVVNETVGITDGAVEATFNVSEVDVSRPLEFVGLYVGTTSFVDRTNMAVSAEAEAVALASLADPITLSIELSEELAGRSSVFVRIGVKTLGIAEMLFSPIHEISL